MLYIHGAGLGLAIVVECSARDERRCHVMGGRVLLTKQQHTCVVFTVLQIAGSARRKYVAIGLKSSARVDQECDKIGATMSKLGSDVR